MTSRDLLEKQIVLDVIHSEDTTVLAELLSLLTDEQVYNALSDGNQEHIKGNLIKDIAFKIINEQGTLVQEGGFKQVPVHHMTTREFNVDGDVVLYIGAESLFCESGGEYPINELSIDEVKEIHKFFH
tara:strand:+ start:256 stop:639 length:384 start_codon:yes stop_codon:yes gene_type:complete